MTIRWSTRLGGALLMLAVASPARAGGLTHLTHLQDGGGGIDGLAGALALAVTPDGAHVYVAGADDDAIAIFARDAGTGGLSFVGVARDGSDGVADLRVPDALAVSPDGAHVYVTSREANALVVFARTPATGALAFVQSVRDGVGGVDGIDRASGVAVSADGSHVYATGEHDDAVATFARNAASGTLAFVGVRRDGVGGVAGIGRPSAVTVSADGASVYVAGGAADGVGVFARDASTGILTFLEAKRYGEETHGVDRPNSLVVTSDGRSLYVAGHDDDGVAAFARDPADGRLTFVEIEKDHGFLGGLAGAFAVAATPDGRYVFAAGENDHTVSTLRRDPTTSALAFVEAARDGRLGVDGLRRASAVAVSPDGAHLYALGHDDDAIVVFAVDRCGNAVRGADEECDDGNLAAGDGCSDACRLELCAPSPMTGCRRPTTAGAARLLVTRNAVAARDALAWHWTKGAATTRAELGDPTGATSYVLCVYDASGAPQPRAASAAPGGGDCAGTACWQPTPPGFLYRDRLATPDGLTRVRLAAGAVDGTAKIVVEGHGAALATPTLPLTAPVVVQLTDTDTGVCWEATHAAPSRSDAARFQSPGE